MILRITAHFAGALLALVALVWPVLARSGEAAASEKAIAQLGKLLFFDASLSSGQDVSCASCHQPDHAFTDGKPVSIGSAHQRGTRNVPSLLALGDGPYFWDGRTTQLEGVVPQPFFNPVEMGLAAPENLLERLRASMQYRRAFALAFPESGGAITSGSVEQALATFIRSQEPGLSAYERYAAGGNPDALTSAAKRGLALFQGPANCAECHLMAGARFTDDAFHSTLINPKLAPLLPAAAVELSHAQAGRQTLGAEIESDARVSELGRYVVTLDPKDIGAFRTPSLCNVALTAPYMHDGSVATLREAVDREIYYRNLQSNRPNTLTEQDRRDLVAFLESLSQINGVHHQTASK